LGVTDPRDQEIAELRRQVAELQAALAAALAEIAALKDELGKSSTALAEIAALKEELGKSSKNSSKPPSSDGPAERAERKKKPPTGRKPGGQPGHEGHGRALVPREKVRHLTVCKPKRCAKCLAGLDGVDPEPLRHQVAHLPKVEPIVDEYELHALGCGCGHVTRAELPPGVPTRAFGPSVDATVATLLTVYRLSRRMVPDFLEDFFGLTMATGSVVKCQQAASEAVAKPVEDAHAHAKACGVKYCDETGWREARGKAFLWTVVTAAVTVFVIQARRTGAAAKHALGAVHGLLGTDRHGAYNNWPDILRQFCWAHLTRAFVAIADRGGASKRIGDALLAEKDQMFIWWHRVRDGTLTHTSFRRYMKPLQDRVRCLLLDGTRTCANTKTGRTCQKLLDHFHALWTFVYREGIEPTNNGAERALRHAVILRKLCYGSHSAAGSRFTERMLTCHATLHQQGRSVLSFLTEACEAALRGATPPSLLPEPERSLSAAA
jgi:transposase